MINRECGIRDWACIVLMSARCPKPARKKTAKKRRAKKARKMQDILVANYVII
jgi:hypothetical protein